MCHAERMFLVFFKGRLVSPLLRRKLATSESPDYFRAPFHSNRVFSKKVFIYEMELILCSHSFACGLIY